MKEVSGDVERASWLCLSAWFAASADRGRNQGLGIEYALSWFLDIRLSTTRQSFWRKLDAEIRSDLECIANSPGVYELLPYILEVHGPGSRLSVMRDPSTNTARTAKKTAGVFYTPPDVASFMARSAFSDCTLESAPKVLDPAVGTGVFLRAALVELVKRTPSSNTFHLACDTLFGCDIDPIALDGAATVILVDCLDAALEAESSPFEAWSRLRRNLVHIDTLSIDPDGCASKSEGRKEVSEVFPSAAEGFDVILGNPPYARFGSRNDWHELAHRFETVAANPTRTADLYPVFIEQMTRLAGSRAHGALVVPLSVACNSGRQFSTCRHLIERQSGIWRFAHFDRQPHALFGEDVKTRNTIILWEKRQNAKSVYSGPLRKWRGQDRQRMLEAIEYTKLEVGIRPGIPKINGTMQSRLLADLSQHPLILSHIVKEWGRSTLREVPGGAEHEVFVAPTAYNFLGIARPFSHAKGDEEVLSTNPLIRLSFCSVEDAKAGYALLSSNLVFWWWHVHGDGFHVNRATLQKIPVGQSAFASSTLGQLANLGEELWEAVQRAPNRSVNRGKVSYTFSASSAPEIKSEIDAVLLQSLGQEARLARELAIYHEIATEARLFEPDHLKNHREEAYDKTRAA
ncbi:N-6 DNA methylase [Ruegeria sp. AU67]|uniref:Eco57I restriction-modification methylase domain-containing protein n=1 Tax=Ruegeria sp. AU67 TaxID=2108530 RepID=UPI00135A332B|nr:N-6 DNA methylase [Ruegeria sp. AU67]